MDKEKLNSAGLSPKAIYDIINKKVVGQEEAKKMISNLVFMNFVRYCQSIFEERPIKKSNGLLMGPTGCGKTYIVREAAKAIRELTGYPICKVLEIDCTELSGRGWEGENISDRIKQHKRECESILEFDTSIVFLDEFDKLCRPAVSSSGNDHNRITQYNLLKMMEGTEMQGGIDTSKLLFVLAGNFAEVRALRKETKKGIGFTKGIEKAHKFVDYHTELDRVGMATQLVGRTAHVAELYELSPDNLRHVLDNHLLPEVESTWEFLNQELDITEEQKKEIVNNCFQRKTGARGLQTDLAKVVEDKLFNIEFEI